jgi:hypothetical protein
MQTAESLRKRRRLNRISADGEESKNRRSTPSIDEAQSDEIWESPALPAHPVSANAVSSKPVEEIAPDNNPAAPVPGTIHPRLIHPLTKFQDEITLWIYDEHCGSMPNDARDKLGLPHDTITRAAFRHILAMEQSVLSMSVKEKRRLYLLMRHLTGGGEHLTVVREGSSKEKDAQLPAYTSHRSLNAGSGGGEGRDESQWRTNREHLATSSSEYLVPELGMTLGQLSVFHILLTRTHCMKQSHLDEIVAEKSSFPFEPITISTSQS